LEQCIVSDFQNLTSVEEQLTGYDACFYCAGVSSAGMSEADYTKISYDTVMHLAETLARLNPKMIFTHVTGAHTDGTEKGRVMWARVKGRAENALMKLPFAEVYNFRPGLMKPSEGQKSIKTLYKVLLPLLPIMKIFFPLLTLHEVGRAMIHAVTKGSGKHVLEVEDIRALAQKN
ncbi:MAG: epimerase, partial [Polyangiaceae bacterium]